MTPERPAVLGIQVHAVELSDATEIVIEAARERKPLGVSALAVHGLVLASRDPEMRHRVNDLELVVADGQPVRWALNWLHGAGLAERVFGPDLTLEVCRGAAEEEAPVYLYGSTAETLEQLESGLSKMFPNLKIAGTRPSRFRPATEQEAADDVAAILKSGARIVFVGLGCPRQEIWTYETRLQLSMPVLAVGAAFDYHAGLLRRAPSWMSRSGLEWLYRLIQEPRRLWVRYATTNPIYVAGVIAQKLGRDFDSIGKRPEKQVRPG